MEPNSSIPDLLASTPASLRKMLVREAAFALSRRSLTSALAAAKAREREVKATRPPFMILMPAKAKQEIVSNLEESKNTCAVLQAGLDKLDLLEPRLLVLVSFRLENHLRRGSSDYAGGLASYRYPDDWLRLKTRLDAGIRDYHAALKNLADICAIMGPHETLGTHAASRQLLADAIALGGQLEADVEFINKVAHAQRKRFGPEGFTLKLQAGVNWQEAARSLHDISARSAPATLHDLIAQSHPRALKISNEVAAEMTLTLNKAGHDIASYHATQWAALREAALLKTNPGELEALVKETETLLETGEFKTWSMADESCEHTAPTKPGTPSSKPPVVVVHAPKPVPRPPLAQTLKLPSRGLSRAPFDMQPPPAPEPAADSKSQPE